MFWPIEVELQDFFPMEYLFENKSIQLINELNYNIVDIDIEKKGDRYETSLQSKHGYYRVHFKELKDEIYEVTLRYDREKPSAINLSQYIKDFNKDLDSTEKSNSIEIFSFVASSVMSFIKKYNPTGFHISANERKKNNAYSLFINDVSKKLNWKVLEKKNESEYEAFILNPNKKLNDQ